MAHPFMKPTDTASGTYDADLARFNAEIAGVRRKSSPDITVVVTETQLPEDVIVADEYLGAARRKVFRDTGITSISPNDELYPDIVQLVTNLLAIDFIPQLAQILQDGQLQDVTRYQEVKWKSRVEALMEQYIDLIDVINPGAETDEDPSISLTSSGLR